MGLLGKIDSTKKVNVWLLTFISLIPFICIYSFARIKKFRKMLAVNVVTVLIFVIYLILRYDLANEIQAVFYNIQIMNYIVLPAVDAFFVWKWARQYNKEIEQKALI